MYGNIKKVKTQKLDMLFLVVSNTFSQFLILLFHLCLNLFLLLMSTFNFRAYYQKPCSSIVIFSRKV